MRIPRNRTMAALILLIAGMSFLQSTGAVRGFVSADGGTTIPLASVKVGTNPPPGVGNQASLQVQPSSATIAAGEFAKFKINVIASPSGEVSLVARGVPPDSLAIFTPNAGQASPEFNSSLTIVTSPDTPPWNYAVTTVAIVNGTEYTDQLGLQILASAGGTTSTSAAMNSTLGTTLSMTLDTDQSQYRPNSRANVQGQVTDATGNAVADATVALQVDDPTGTQIFYTNNILTDSAGTFQTQVALTPSALAGTYTVFGSASKSGYTSITTRTTFIVGTSTTPSVIIKAVYAGDSARNPTSTFTRGQTIWVWVAIQNIGSTFQGVVWVQVHDPNGVPVQIETRVALLEAGQTINDGLALGLPANAPIGVYTVNVLVSDKLISQGGTFLASSETQFALTS